MQLDKYDQKLIALLVEEARQSVTELSKRVNLSRSAVTERIKRLEDKGVITGYHASINHDAEHAVMAYFSLTFRPLSCDLIQPYVEQIPEVKLAHSISGDVDMILLVESPSMTRLNEIRIEIDSWPNINKVLTHMCLATRLDRK
ncbi:Lrp/AsnC family transcriptional regulator [Marinomonas mediterranea]|jgi:transcriptional regulator, AsnC family|uniref:Transcriptional regulator, AsnC family n=1 Tax=Marinomonas mediterranea (strain ATCC 700492 / JCM 21426 / NBRC 103028 / MMB-1) TaxID=717774 RepID=F2K319_MARM1|nr:Lrp/AsnC family transcriptional regulator [Marinomonas mediterranea]ADZ92408.1 transcriptional regulator, AsnC family [Marinomonas mediterranea MMB-1]WCN10359.1 winged helix-turn-helix transcriptional regulator [Marinomonas mediterranea]WCN14405.1 winged helix-turn-helix transcriptional regulator [Marinomonas mediterranea]WCN18457.1 winged helix-turn-helix transcriptional regulator [Marinomonas mediterranea MMB-1]